MLETIAYKVLTAEQLTELQRGGWRGSALDLQDGFIHLSAAAQLTETVDKHFAGRSDLVVAAIDLAALGAAVRWEQSRGGALFPHVYGDLPPSAVLAHAPLARNGSGEVVRPA
ncbi:DUF952 domain-containing protein [Allosphingosinicella deserti]|uniref:DUF952 domain-containing protein n=1 Tax=Allosphingosinicella deserti TaxID=2116704 RepID=A0A2P7QLM3_9SPHN|nr:DUF952 domain-containing protein [Sphingomonas deserti]PSJ38844.1 DUF952 domain-containing protein [Sphingomonas deserti]